jgi:dTDP-glucose 4,6-dehydratase
MKILVTGGAGFVGSQYVRAILAGEYVGYENARVTVVDKLTYAGNLTSLPARHPRLDFIEADVCDPREMMAALPGHDAVVHFAAESHVDRSLLSARQFALTNVVGTQNLLECCLRAGVPRVVQVSTDEVYGSIESGSWREDDPLAPNSPYSASKSGGDLMARAYYRTHGLDVRVTRCCNNYGPYQCIEKLIPLFVTNLLDGKDVPLYGDGQNQREWIHVADHCQALQLVLDRGRPGECYNIGGQIRLTNAELTGQLLALCGAGQDRIRPVADRKGHDRRYAVDDGKIRRELGYQPLIPFSTGLADTVAWYRANRRWWGPQRQAVRLPVPASGRRGQDNGQP